MSRVIKRVCVYCGSNSGLLKDYGEAARACGALLARRGMALVYGGGNIGLMGILADAALEAGGEVIGVIPARLFRREVVHRDLTSLVTVNSMHERKKKMADLSDAFIALPGGIGTMDEMFEMYTWLQLGIHSKPIGLLNVAGFYDPLVQFLSHMQERGFLKKPTLDMLVIEKEMALLIERLGNAQPVPETAFLNQEQPPKP